MPFCVITIAKTAVAKALRFMQQVVCQLDMSVFECNIPLVLQRRILGLRRYVF